MTCTLIDTVLPYFNHFGHLLLYGGYPLVNGILDFLVIIAT
jgi:hypothetical protein